LDDVLGQGFSCDLVKIDVEGHELGALLGMRAILRRSPGVKILFEKLSPNRGDEVAIEAFLSQFGLSIYAVGPGSCLRRIQAGALAEFSGNVLAAAEELDGSDRRRFAIYPRQLRTSLATMRVVGGDRLTGFGTRDEILFHGPYWFLRAGIYRVTLAGEVFGKLRLALTARMGHVCVAAFVTGQNPSFVAVIERDLLLFECVGTVADVETRIDLAHIFVEHMS
jgi:hypothetical protein